MTPNPKVLIVGAGLSGSLLAISLKRKHPQLSLALIDASSEPFQNQTWSFHASDLESNLLAAQEIASFRWDGYSVHFRKFEKTYHSTYFSLKPRDLRKRLIVELGTGFQSGRKVVQVRPQSVTLEDGSILKADCILDARGEAFSPARNQGFQKFVGLHCVLKKTHGLTRPILMDAQVPQLDGYRFFYCLPFSETEVLIEDTRYSNEPDLKEEQFEREIRLYAGSKGWSIERVLEKEKGILPIPFESKVDIEKNKTPTIGVRGDFFHPVTGYSFAYAAQVAETISSLNDFKPETVQSALISLRKKQAGHHQFFHLLNRLMFLAAEPQKRIQIFEHFYSLPASVIQNFYQGRLSWSDRLRIMSGKPPVPITKALQHTIGVWP